MQREKCFFYKSCQLRIKLISLLSSPSNSALLTSGSVSSLILNAFAELLLSSMQSPVLWMFRKLVMEIRLCSTTACIPTFAFTHQKEIIILHDCLFIWECQTGKKYNRGLVALGRFGWLVDFLKAFVLQMKLLNGVWSGLSFGASWFPVYFPQTSTCLYFAVSQHTSAAGLFWFSQKESSIVQSHKLTGRIRKPVSGSAQDPWQMRKERLWDLLYICVTAHASSGFCVSQE